ncbi:Agamous-like MADS-box protein AGL36 [Linum grandiflorum]
MVRTKVQHELIINESARKASFRKRKLGLWNKLKEISTLCGVAACGIIFYNFNGKIDVWPSVPEAVDILKKLKVLPDKKQKKYQLDHDSMLDASVEKLEETLKNEIEKNQWLEIEWLLTCEDENLMEGTSSCGYENLNDHKELERKREMLDELIKKIDERIEYLKIKNE